VVVVSLVFFNIAFAQSNTSTSQDLLIIIKQLQAQVQSLQAQIADLQAQVQSVKTELKFTRALSQGVTGDDVKQLQEFLKTFPDVYPEGLVTGYFGPLTEAAVKKFQEQNGIESVGIVGPITQAKLTELAATGAGQSGIIPPGLVSAGGTPPSTPLSTPSNTIPAQPIGQTSTTTIPATPAQPVTSSGGGLPSPPPPPPPPPPPTSTSTNTTSDTTPPSMPTNLSASAVSTSQINLSWSASTDDTGVVGYKIYRGGTQIATITTSTSYSNVGLQASTAYTYTVAAYDTAGNISVQSSQASATTLPEQTSGATQIKHTLLTSGSDSTEGSTFTTATISPAPNTLVTVAISTSDPNAANTRIAAISGGGMPSWDELAQQYVGNHYGDDGVFAAEQGTFIYRAMASSVSNGPITFTFSGPVKNAQWIVSQWSGIDTSGTNGSGAIGETMSGSRRNITEATLSSFNSFPLGIFTNANDVNYSVFGLYTGTAVVTPGTGFTEISEQSSGDGAAPSDLEAEWMANNRNISASWGGISLDVGFILVHVKAAL